MKKGQFVWIVIPVFNILSTHSSFFLYIVVVLNKKFSLEKLFSCLSSVCRLPFKLNSVPPSSTLSLWSWQPLWRLRGKTQGKKSAKHSMLLLIKPNCFKHLIKMDGNAEEHITHSLCFYQLRASFVWVLAAGHSEVLFTGQTSGTEIYCCFDTSTGAAHIFALLYWDIVDV